MTIEKDGTGRIYANGRVGTLVEWLRWITPLLLTIFMGTLIPAGIWIVREHQEFRGFMQACPRVTPVELAKERLEIMREVAELMDELPPDSYEHLVDVRFEQVVNRLDDNASRISALESEVSRMGRDVAVIRRILEN